MNKAEEIKIGLLGLGTVGLGVWKHLQSRASLLEAEVGVPLRIVRAAVKNPDKVREVSLPKGFLTTDPNDILNDPEIDIVCELVGGTDAAREWTISALKAGKTVVTANKALLCDHGDELFAVALACQKQIYFEASVAGGMPIIKTLCEGLVVNQYDHIYGILNGTSNYILTQMEKESRSFSEMLDNARKLGYVEADEALDLDGWDAAHKTVILAWLAFRKWVPTEDMIVEGVRNVTLDDIQFATELGYRIKLIARIDFNPTDCGLFLSVRPTLVPLSSLMADVDGAFNAIHMNADIAGPTVLTGRGAGQDPTASAVISDLVDASRTILNPSPPRNRGCRGYGERVHTAKLGNFEAEYYVRLLVEDRPGVLADVAKAFSEANVSIATVIQRETKLGGSAFLVLQTHTCSERAIRSALGRLDQSQAVQKNRLYCPLLAVS